MIPALAFFRFLRIAVVFLMILSLARPLSGAGKSPTYRSALPGYTFAFPRDHRAHEDFRTEWWYYNGHLTGPQGERFGYQLTFFRVGLLPGPPPREGSRWNLREVYLAHLAVSDIEGKRFHYREKAFRGALGLAGSDPRRYRVWVETWQAEEDRGNHRLEALDGDLGVAFTLTPLRPAVIHGKDGVSQKGPQPGQASHYYSLTRMETHGELTLYGRRIPVKGLSWMDHEFGSNQLAEDQVGWDWFSLQGDDGMDLMIYQLRSRAGLGRSVLSGTLVLPDGNRVPLPAEKIILRAVAFWKSPHSRAVYPAAWEIEIPDQAVKVKLVPFFHDQELMTSKSTGVTYWEGAVRAEGLVKGRPWKGKGYVEMTGYDRPFRPKI